MAQKDENIKTSDDEPKEEAEENKTERTLIEEPAEEVQNFRGRSSN